MIVLTLATSVLLARVLGPEAFGLYAFALSVVTLSGLPVQLGVPVIVLRETAKAGAVDDWDRMRGVWVWAGRRILLGVLVVVPLVALGGLLSGTAIVPPGGHGVLYVALGLVPLIAVSNVRASALRGLHHPVLGQLPETLVRPGGLFALVGLMALLGVSVTAEAAMTAHVVASCAAFAVGAVLLSRLAPEGVRKAAADLSDAPAWKKAVLPLALISGMQLLMQNVGVVMLGMWRDPQEIGWFRIAMAAANMVLFGLTVANQIVAPRLAQLHAQKDPQEMARTARLSAGVSLLAAAPIALVLLLAGRWVLGSLYGDAFRPAYDAMAFLVLAQLVNAFFGSCVSVLNMSGHERDTARALIAAAVINLALSAILIPTMGGPGAGIATLCSTLVWNGLMERSVRRNLGFSSTPLGYLFNAIGGKS